MTGILWMDILVSIATVGALATAIFWIAAYFVMRVNVKSFSVLEDELGKPFPLEDSARLPRISVIVPAHNEESGIAAALDSIRASDYAALEIIVVADRCTDRTVEIVRSRADEDDRVLLIEKTERDPEWSGKCHACWTGYRHASGDWLLFTDADTNFHPRLIKTALSFTLRNQYDGLSLWGRLRATHLYERFVQPVAGMVVGRIFPPRRVNHADPARRRPHANGQFILLPRHVYEKAGTHESVKQAMLEDIQFARKVHRAGFRVYLASATGLFSASMYDSFSQFRDGWMRIMIEAAGQEPRRLRKFAFRTLAFGLLSGWPVLMLPVAVSLCFTSNWLGWVLLATTIIALGWALAFAASLFSIQGAQRVYAVFFPVACFIVAGILHQGASRIARGSGIDWGGQVFTLKNSSKPKNLQGIRRKKTAISQV